jgi:ubiquinol-cytochrome c reductase cytochrome c subunit
VSWINARRRRPVAGYAALLLGLVVVGLIYGAFTRTSAQASPAAQQDVTAGKALFQANCATCHGLEAQGTNEAPSLIGTGAAAVDFQMSTGRMPAKEVGPEMPRKPVTFSQQQIYQIAGFIASLGGGPPIPDSQQVSTSRADTALGEQLFNANCAQCHNAGLSGGALTYGKYAPALTQATATQIYEAMLTGPEAMPVFSDGSLSPQAKRDLIAYVLQTRTEPNPGGFSLGRTGPTTEGLVIWIGGLGFLILFAMWITAKRRDARHPGASETSQIPEPQTSGTEH